MKNFLDKDFQIELNTKVLDDLINGYNKTQTKVSILVLFYSIITIYLIPFISAIIDFQPSFIYYVFCASFLTFFVLFLRSLYFTFLLLKPNYISFSQQPSFFYKDLQSQYRAKLNSEDPDVLNEYIKTSYLEHLEEAIDNNNNLFIEKSGFYFKSFQSVCLSMIFYAFCVGYVQFITNK